VLKHEHDGGVWRGLTPPVIEGLSFSVIVGLDPTVFF